MVSVPFADHGDVLTDTQGDFHDLSVAVAEELERKKLRYVEIRPAVPLAALDSVSCRDFTYCLHRLDLGQNIATLANNLHRNSTLRKIQRAEREGLIYQEGASDCLLDAFNRLWLITRRRHGAPPQPVEWFRNLIRCFQDKLKIRVAFKDRQPVAAILTLKHKDTMIYKYGCSDSRFHRLGGMHLLLWRSILEGKEEGLRVFDFGRSELTNQGLITFKDRWGAERTGLTYMRLTPSSNADWQLVKAPGGFMERLTMLVCRKLPASAFRFLGSAMYPHLG